MKRIVIVAPCFPPCNLTGVHRLRFLASHLEECGWKPIVLTVKPQYYKEKPDYELQELVPLDLEVIRTNAIRQNFLIGDISIRCFLWHWAKLRQLARNKQIDFIFISLFPAYSTLLGRLIYEEFKVPYIIDYQDPWIMYHQQKETIFSKAWFSAKLAAILEPVAVKKVSLLTSVADSYLEGVISRNSHLEEIPKVIMPIGFDPDDFEHAFAIGKEAYLFKPKDGNFNFIYAGAMLPYGYVVLDLFFKSLIYLRENNPKVFNRIKVYFVGTGKSPNDKNGYNVMPLARGYGLYGNTVYEYPARMPYLDILIHLKHSDAVLVLGSSEEHYTPSKIFPAVFSKRPILAILHEKSPVLRVLKESNAAKILSFPNEKILGELMPQISRELEETITSPFDETKVNYTLFNEFSAPAAAAKLASAMDEITFNK